MGFRNPIVNASQVVGGVLRLRSGSVLEQEPGEVVAEAVNRPGGHPTARAVLRTPDIGHGHTSLIVYPHDAFYWSRAYVVDDSTGDLTDFAASAFFVYANESDPLGTDMCVPAWHDPGQRVLNGRSWTANTDGSGLWTVGHSLGVVPALVVGTVRGAAGRWVTLSSADNLGITFLVHDAAGVVASTSVTIDYYLAGEV